MTAKEEASFRLVYSQWPTDRLARATTLEKKEYLPEAVALMIEELGKRGVEETRIPEIVASAPPPVVALAPERDTLFFPARLNRKQYLVRFLLLVGCVAALAIALESLPSPFSSASLAVGIVGLVYSVMGLDIPRMRNAGLSPWLLALMLVPVLGFGMYIVLFFAAPDETNIKRTS